MLVLVLVLCWFREVIRAARARAKQMTIFRQFWRARARRENGRSLENLHASKIDIHKVCRCNTCWAYCIFLAMFVCGRDSALKSSGVHQLQQVEILEIAKFNLEEIPPPSLEEPRNHGGNPEQCKSCLVPHSS